MLFVFIALILSLALIPLVLIDLRIKVSETQFDMAIRSLEVPEEVIAAKAEKRIRRKFILSQFKSINWNTGFVKLKNSLGNVPKNMKKACNNGYTFIKGICESLIKIVRMPNQSIKDKNKRTNRS